MQQLFFLFVFLPFFLHASSDLLFSEEEDPCLFHHVNVISGDLNLCVNDGEVKGGKNLPIYRIYSSHGALESANTQYDLYLEFLT